MNEPSLNKVERIDHDFLYFYAMNTPWCAAKMNAAPLSNQKDGYNDIITSTRQMGAGHCSLFSLLLSIETGDFFD